MKTSISTIDQLKEYTQVFLDGIEKSPTDKARIYVLTGPLGAGKTTFVKTVALMLGVKDIVVSPTFNLMKIYEVMGNPSISTLIHVDAYRLEKEEELSVLNLSQYFEDPTVLMFIEWGEKVMTMLPSHTKTIIFSHEGEHERLLSHDIV